MAFQRTKASLQILRLETVFSSTFYETSRVRGLTVFSMSRAAFSPLSLISTYHLLPSAYWHLETMVTTSVTAVVTTWPSVLFAQVPLHFGWPHHLACLSDPQLPVSSLTQAYFMVQYKTMLSRMLSSWHVKFMLLTFWQQLPLATPVQQPETCSFFPCNPSAFTSSPSQLECHLTNILFFPCLTNFPLNLSGQIPTLGQSNHLPPLTTLWAAEHHCGKITHGLLVSNLHCPPGALACQLPGHTLSYSPPWPPPSEKTNVFR